MNINDGDLITIKVDLVTGLLQKPFVIVSEQDNINITSNDRWFNCPSIYMDTVNITSNDRSFSYPFTTQTLFTLLSYNGETTRVVLKLKRVRLFRELQGACQVVVC